MIMKYYTIVSCGMQGGGRFFFIYTVWMLTNLLTWLTGKENIDLTEKSECCTLVRKSFAFFYIP